MILFSDFHNNRNKVLQISSFRMNFFNPYSDKAFKWAKYRVNICKGSLFQSRKLVSKSLSFSLVRGIQNRITIDIHTKYLIDNYILSDNYS